MSGLGATKKSSIRTTIINLTPDMAKNSKFAKKGSKGRSPSFPQLPRQSDFTLARIIPIELKNNKVSRPEDLNKPVDKEEAAFELSPADIHEIIESPPAMPSGDIEVLKTKIGNRYRVCAKLGEGGMGSVFRCFDEVDKKWVAVKVAKSAENQYLIADEIKSMLDLGRGSQRLVNCLASGVNFIVFEYLKGETLLDFIRNNRPNNNDGSFRSAFRGYVVNTLKIVREIFKGLEYIHDQGVVHADLALDNVMLSETDVKILDFGIAELVNKAEPNVVFGKPYAISPEQARAEQLDGQTDIYSAGIILYSMLTGRKPYTMSPLSREFPRENFAIEILLRKQKGDPDVLGYPLPVVGKSEILNIFGEEDTSWRDLFIDIWTIRRGKVIDIFGNDTSWKRFFVDPDSQLTFKPEIKESEITSIQDTKKREALLAMFRLTQRDILTFRPDAEKIILNSKFSGELKTELLRLLADGYKELRESVPFYNLEEDLKMFLGDFPGERLYNLLNKMTAADKEERFQTATAARLAVEIILENIESNSPSLT